MQARKKLFLLIFAIIMTAGLSACCRQHFLKNFDQVKMTSEQMILEARGDTVPFVLHVHVPEGLLCGGLELRLVPCLKQGEWKTPFSAHEKPAQPGLKDTLVVRGRKASEYVFTGYFMNFPQLQNSHFVVEWSGAIKDKTAPLSERLVGYGISQIYHQAADIIHLEPGFDADSVRNILLARPSQSAQSYYLLALLSARMYDQQGIQNYLQKATSLDPFRKTEALNDVSFIAYRKESWFQQITK